MVLPNFLTFSNTSSLANLVMLMPFSLSCCFILWGIYFESIQYSIFSIFNSFDIFWMIVVIGNIKKNGLVIKSSVDSCIINLFLISVSNFAKSNLFIEGLGTYEIFSYLISNMISEAPYPNHISGMTNNFKISNI